MTNEELQAICDRLAEGTPLRAICRDMGRPESSIRYHLNKDENARDHTVRARELGCDALADECIEIADEPVAKGDVVAVANKRVRIDARLRLIGKWSQRYGDKTTHEHTGKDGGPISTTLDLEGLSDDQLRALASIPVQSE